MAETLIEDKPPMLRFEQTSRIDNIGSEQAGKPVYMPVTMVFISASGDLKCEVPFEVKKTAYDAFVKKVDVKKPFTRHVENKETGETEEIQEEVMVQEDRTFYTKKIVEPWKDSLKFRLKNGAITQNFYNYCVKAQENFEQNIEMPSDGFPVKEWYGVEDAHKRRLIELGMTTVERAAEMTEEGMAAFGMGARSVKQKAEAFINTDRSHEANASKLQKMASENEDLRDNLSDLERKINELMANNNKSQAPVEDKSEDKEPPQKRTRRTKEQMKEANEAA